jgi:hypothetical protein
MAVWSQYFANMAEVYRLQFGAETVGSTQMSEWLGDIPNPWQP